VTNFDQAMAELSAKHAVRPLKQALVGDRRRAFVILMGAATFLLLIACANVANLLLSDAAARRREIALRAALGASQGRMVRQLLTESLLLAFAGAAVGLALAPIALRVLRALMPENLAGVAAAEIDVRVLAFAAALAVLTGLSFGLWPAFGAARTDAGEMVKSGSRGGTSGVGTARRVLITTELALTVMLLIGSGLMLRSLDRVLAQRMGMIPEHVGTLELSMPGAAHAVQTTTVHAILTRLEGEPGITAVGVVNQLPLRGEGGFSIAITVDGVPPPSSIDATPFARFLSASGGYFQAMGIPLLRGRTFTAADDSTAPLVAVISETMARVCWPNADPIGKTFHFADRGPATVVGVVADVREQAIDGEIQPQLYLPFDVEPDLNLAIVARSALAPTTLLARLRDAVRSADPSQPVYNIRMMDDVISTAVAPRRTNTTLIVLFGAVALALAAFGVYAVVSYGVTRRARELGIRAALGATGSDIAALIAREMLWVTGLGLTIGLAGAWALSRVLSALLYGVDRHDAITFAIVPLVLLLPAAIATLVPARRAMRVDPAVVMRQE
jgi:predicted permease